MPKFILGLAFLILLLPGFARAVGTVSLEEALSKKVLGRDDAPVVMVEYSSLGCPHCADFHEKTLPLIKRDYIDTGKVRMIYNDFPFGAPALGAAMLARCVGEEKYFATLEILFRGQKTWGASKKPLEALGKTMRFAGMSKADFDACLKNEALMKGIQANQKKAQEALAITSTPTFFIDGVKVEGAQPYEHFKKVIDAALAKAR